jgi:hypothetical protein
VVWAETYLSAQCTVLQHNFWLDEKNAGKIFALAVGPEENFLTVLFTVYCNPPFVHRFVL